jgi:hypothetical protein
VLARALSQLDGHKKSVSPRLSFGDPWSCLTSFGTSTGRSKAKKNSKQISRALVPVLEIFRFWFYVMGMGMSSHGFTHI